MPTPFQGTITLATLPPPSTKVTFCGLISENRSWNAEAPAEKLSPTAASVCIGPNPCCPASSPVASSACPSFPFAVVPDSAFVLLPLPPLDVSPPPPNLPSIEKRLEDPGPPCRGGVAFPGPLELLLGLLLLLLLPLFRFALS
ncbi:unnamed protein product, partial [Ectocarpus sp. 8 AP-2014]